MSFLLGNEEPPLLLSWVTPDQLCLPSTDYVIVVLLYIFQTQIIRNSWMHRVTVIDIWHIQCRSTENEEETHALQKSPQRMHPCLSQRHSIPAAELLWTTCAQNNVVSVQQAQNQIYKQKHTNIVASCRPMQTWSVRSSAMTSSKPASLSIWG